MKGIRWRFVGFLLVAGIGFNTYIYGEVLHQERTEQVLTKGVTYINDKLLMSEGWRNINILKINLNDDNVEIKPIETTNGAGRQTVLDLVTHSGAIAGINADYFDMSTNNTPSLGTLISNGVLRQAYNSNYSELGINKNMATFAIDTSNTPSVEYYGVSIRINANGALVGAATTKNKIPSILTRPVIVDSTYYKTTNNIVSNLKTAYSIVVDNNIVTYQSKSGEGVTIPTNGYVILVPEKSASEYRSKLSIGTVVDLEETVYLQNGLSEAVNQLKLGIGGSGIIMKNGAAYTGPAHIVAPSSQVARTVVATVKGSHDILLITIDGKGKYTGINHKQLIEILKRYNVDSAMYLDGGGSTTFVSRTFANSSVELQNSPADGAQRKVVNGLGVFTTQGTGELNTLFIKTNRERTFTGEPINLSVKGIDANSNPVAVNNTDVNYSVVNGTGTFSGNVFTPTSTGNLLIVAEKNGIEAATEIYVSERPVGLLIEPSLVQVTAGNAKNVYVYGLDSKGYKIPINAENIAWETDNQNVTVDNNKVSASGTALAKLTASYKGVEGQMGVVGGKAAVAIESFESNGGKWSGEPSTVTGKVEFSKDIKYYEDKCLKMTYTFMPSKEKQIAYTVFNNGIDIPSDASSINMWLYAKKQGHAAKIEVVDSNGRKFCLKLSDSLDFEGWKYVSTTLPEDMVLPATVTKFYVYSNSNESKLKTAVYLDHVSITRGFRNRAGITTRADYKADPFYKETLQQPIGGQYIINVVGQTKVGSLLTNSNMLSKMSNQLASGASSVLFASSKNSELKLDVPTHTYKNVYEAIDYDNTKVIMLGTNSGGLRKTGEKQWIYLKQSIEKSNAKNIILIMSKNPLTEFSDALEGQALHNYLKGLTDKNIFVVTAGGNESEVRIEDGIRYIRNNGINVNTDNYKDGSFVKFKIDNDKIYYTIEQFN